MQQHRCPSNVLPCKFHYDKSINLSISYFAPQKFQWYKTYLGFISRCSIKLQHSKRQERSKTGDAIKSFSLAHKNLLSQSLCKEFRQDKTIYEIIVLLLNATNPKKSAANRRFNKRCCLRIDIKRLQTK